MIWLETKYGLAEVYHGFVKLFLLYNPARMRFFLKDSLRIKKAQVLLKTFCTRNLSFSIRKLLHLIPIESGRVACPSPAGGASDPDYIGKGRMSKSSGGASDPDYIGKGRWFKSSGEARSNTSIASDPDYIGKGRTFKSSG